MTTIPALRDSDGKISHTPKEVNCLSRDFIEGLYSPQTEASNFEIDASLNTLDLPKIINEYIMAIYSPISMAGLTTLHRMCSISKAPGTDSFTAEFCKELLAMLSPITY